MIVHWKLQESEKKHIIYKGKPIRIIAGFPDLLNIESHKNLEECFLFHRI